MFDFEKGLIAELKARWAARSPMPSDASFRREFVCDFLNVFFTVVGVCFSLWVTRVPALWLANCFVTDLVSLAGISEDAAGAASAIAGLIAWFSLALYLENELSSRLCSRLEFCDACGSESRR